MFNRPTPDQAQQIRDSRRAKAAQFERIKDAMPGLQLVRRRKTGTTTLVYHRPATETEAEFYESVLIGRLPRVMHKVVGGPARQAVRVELAEHEKPLNRRAVDLTDQHIDRIIARWKAGKSALDLPYVLAVWGRDAKMQTKEPGGAQAAPAPAEES